MRVITTPMTKEMMEDAIISIEAQRLVDAVCAQMLQHFAEDCDEKMKASIANMPPVGGVTEEKACLTPDM